MTFMLSDDRKEVVGIVDKGEAINYRDVEDIMLRILKSFPGDMEIIVIDGVVRFRLRGHGSRYVDLNYIFNQLVDFREHSYHFITADRWIYYYTGLPT